MECPKPQRNKNVRFAEKAGHVLSEILRIFFMSSKLLQKRTGDFPPADGLPHTPVGLLKQNIFAGARDFWKNPWLSKNVKHQIKLKR